VKGAFSLLENHKLLAPVGYCDDLMKPTKWRCSRPYEHMWIAWRVHEDWRLGL